MWAIKYRATFYECEDMINIVNSYRTTFIEWGYNKFSESLSCILKSKKQDIINSMNLYIDTFKKRADIINNSEYGQKFVDI
jgi:hypothetical protein